MRHRTMTAAFLAAGLLVGLAACGGEDDDATEPAGADDAASDDTAADASGDEATDGGESAARGGTLKLGIIQDLSSWDPSQAHVGHRLQPYQAPYDTLILREPDGTLSPMLATSWEYTDDSRTELSLDLRTDVTFSDGAAFDADAVVANIEHFMADPGPQVGQSSSIESVSAVDADTVAITLSEPNPAMEYFLSQALGLMGSPASLGTDEMDRTPVGTGPYVLVAGESVVGSQYVFEARDGYWNPDLQKWDRIELRLLSDATARINAVTTGEVDATLVDATTFDQAKGAGLDDLIYTVDVQGVLIFDRDGTIVPALAEPKVRQAINYAFDRENLLQQLAAGQGEVTSQFFGTSTAGYTPELDTAYSYDPEQAKALMAEAGYADGFTMDMPVVPGISDTIMTFVAQQLGDIGITVNQVPVQIADYQGELGSGKFPAAWFSLGQLPAWSSYDFVVSPDALYNPFDTTTPEEEALVERMRLGGDDGDAAAKELGQYLVDEAWFAWWYRPAQLYFYDGSKVSVEAQDGMAVPAIYNYTPAG